MAVKWEKHLETGFEKIDKDHASLISTVNNIIRHIGDGGDTSQIKNEMYLLYHDFIHHVCSEEFIMMLTGYHDYCNHKAEHDNFIKTLTDFEKCDSHPLNSYHDLCHFIINFFFFHIENHDKPLAKSLEDQHLASLARQDHEREIESAVLGVWRTLKAEGTN